jgi:DivIVA domain-containing protein
VTDISPQQVRTATFRTIRKGYDPDEVAAFLRAAAEALEVAQNQSAAMEARARAAVARLQELSGRDAERAAAPMAPPEEAETITRTLLLAQRTADQTVAEARAEAERVLASARAEAESTIDSTREMAARLMDDARTDARAATETDRRAAEGEVMALLARRDFLVADVDHLEAFLVEQRERIRDAAAELTEICDRVPAGLAGVRRPLLSAAADATQDTARDSAADDDTEEHPAPGSDVVEDVDIVDDGDATEASDASDLVISPLDEGWPTGRSGANEDDADSVDAAGDREQDAADAADGSDVGDAGAMDPTPAGTEPQLSFDAADLRRLGETRGLH